MQQRLAEKTAAAVAFSRNILANAAAGLITAALLGFWSPTLKKVEPAQPEIVGELNIDPVSGKILDRVAVDEEPTVPRVRLKPVLVDYAPPTLATEPEAQAAPEKVKKPTAKTQAAPKPHKPSASEPESRNMPVETPAADAVPAQPIESEGWMSKLSPGALSAKLAPVTGYVSGGVAAAKRAVADRLGGFGF